MSWKTFEWQESAGVGTLTFDRPDRLNALTFEVYADTTPVAKWVRHRALTFRVEAAGTGSRLTVIDDYDRLLSPAWFFRPYVRVAANSSRTRSAWSSAATRS